MSPPNKTEVSALRLALRDMKPQLLRAASYTFISGTLMLAPSWFMFEVYGRVLDSRNMRTLWMLLLAVVLVYLIIEAIDLLRARIMHHAATAMDAKVRNKLFDAVFAVNLQRPNPGHVQPFNDLKVLREFMASPPVFAIMDIPAAVMFLGLLYVLGPWLGVMATVGALLQVLIAWSTERRTMPVLGEASKASMSAQAYAGSALRNAQVIESMGMLGNVYRRWVDRQRKFIALQSQASDVGGLNAVGAKVIQQMQGSLLLGGACWLALHNQLLGGPAMMIVASILGGRALQPLAQLVSQWRNVVQAREAFERLDKLLSAAPQVDPGMPLPRPQGVLTVEQVVAGAPATQGPSPAILKGATFNARPGEVVAIIGPSAAGKSTLARVLVGVWPALSGKVRLDGADVFSWNKEELGPHVGYLPQGVELFDGTIAENIARFGSVDRDLVRAAAEDVGLTDMIEALPDGFDTRVGDDAAVLSGGQRQRVALARALYGQPQFVVLDEPNASLDEAGERALLQCLHRLKSRGATVIAITHRTTLLPAADKVAVLHDGQVAAFGPRDDVLAALKKANEQARVRPAAATAAAVPALGTQGARS